MIFHLIFSRCVNFPQSERDCLNTQISFMAIFQAKNMAKMIHLISGSRIARRKAMIFVWGAPREDWPGNKILSGCFFNLTTSRFWKGWGVSHVASLEITSISLTSPITYPAKCLKKSTGLLSIALKISTFQVCHTIRPWRPAKWENDQAFTSKHWTSCKVSHMLNHAFTFT